MTSIASAAGPISSPGAGVQALLADGTVWRFDTTTHEFRGVYGLNGIEAIGGNIDTSYAIA